MIFSEYTEWSFPWEYLLRSGDRIPVGGEIFRTCPDRPWGPPSLLYNGYRVFPGDKATGAWRWPPIPSGEVKEGVELYVYLPSGPSWPVLGWTLSLPLPFKMVAEYSSKALATTLWVTLRRSTFPLNAGTVGPATDGLSKASPKHCGDLLFKHNFPHISDYNKSTLDCGILQI